MVHLLRSSFLALLLASCQKQSGAPDAASSGTISVRWTGSSSGSFSAPTTARWCAADTLLELIAIRGDTAVGLSLIAQDSVRAEIYRANDVRIWTSWRPQASAGLRWLSPLELKGYESYGGQVEVTAGGSQRVAGSFEFRLRPLNGTDTLLMKGSFSARDIQAAAPACGRANRRPPG